MSKTYYNPADLRKFGNITDWNKELGDKFFEYYGNYSVVLPKKK